eukprot:TRINITY_DN4736_c0_g1_i1.p1 TRINITY_DN4736_c0_g1~~TRINITY_DN4736_c0_g1_i1.p1  ORF type:complete len:288 (-),score=60.47 TRINITY_DN4736_c0_g1_i1:31-894(-)
MAKEVDPEEYDALMCISGDGELNSVLNALYKSDQSAEEKQPIPLALIPAGTSNGVATSLGFLDPVVAVLRFLKSKPQKLDCFEVRCLEDEKQIEFATGHDVQGVTPPPFLNFGMLICHWGLTAQIDGMVESKVTRWLGMLRIFLVPVGYLLWNPKFKGKIWCLPDTAPNRDPEHWELIEDQFHYAIGVALPWVSFDILVSPGKQENSGCVTLVFLKCRDSSRVKMVKSFLSMDDGSWRNDKGVKQRNVKEFVLIPEIQNNVISVDGELQTSKPIWVKVAPKRWNFVF